MKCVTYVSGKTPSRVTENVEDGVPSPPPTCLHGAQWYTAILYAQIKNPSLLLDVRVV